MSYSLSRKLDTDLNTRQSTKTPCIWAEPSVMSTGVKGWQRSLTS